MTIMTDMPGGNPAPMGNAPQTDPNAQSYQKMLLAQALMGGSRPGQNSFAGGLAQGIQPIIQRMMMQKMMQGAQVPPAVP